MIADLSVGLQEYTRFLWRNARWLAAGLLLTFSSGVGQTYFIALFAGQIRAEFALSHGEFGVLYMLATLASATTLVWLGKVMDIWSPRPVAIGSILCLASAAVLMATSGGVVTLVIALYGLRLFGQGMMSHVAMTAIGRWFVAERGRAVSLTASGYQLGEGVLPIVIVSLLALHDWRILWAGAAVVLVLFILPSASKLLAVPRTPSARDIETPHRARHWTRAEVIRDPLFWLVVAGVLAPAFIGTSVFFHQVHLAETKGWPTTLVASAFSLMAVCTVVVGLISGRVIDAVGSVRLLPFFLLPLAVACGLLAFVDAPAGAWWFMAMLGISYGISSSVFGALWPELYGTEHLGAVRSLVFAGMVMSSALGPGLTGSLIDVGIHFEHQLAGMSAYCLLASIVMASAARQLRTRAAARDNQPGQSRPAVS